jgi:hypothetical protein
MRDIDTILRHYLACAVWTGTDEHGDPLESTGWTVDDFHESSIDDARFDVERFVSLAGDLMDGISDEAIGHDFWLTRNRRGTGFWRRWLGAAGDRLSEIAHSFGECCVAVDSGIGCLYLD